MLNIGKTKTRNENQYKIFTRYYSLADRIFRSY